MELFDAARTAAAELGRDADAAIALHETGVVFLLLGDFSNSREMIELALRGLLHVYDASQNPRLLLDLGMFCCIWATLNAASTIIRRHSGHIGEPKSSLGGEDTRNMRRLQPTWPTRGTPPLSRST